jgi:hypothetical protein
MIYRFRFWKEWTDQQGRLWAEPYEFDSPVDGRKAHKAALAWDWAKNRQLPSVSDLYSTAYTEDPVTGKKREENRTSIQDGGKREHHASALPGLRSSGERQPVPDAHPVAPAAAERRFDSTPF